MTVQSWKMKFQNSMTFQAFHDLYKTLNIHSCHQSGQIQNSLQRIQDKKKTEIFTSQRENVYFWSNNTTDQRT